MANKNLFLIVSIIVSLVVAASPPQQAQPALSVLDKNGKPISILTDGDSIRLEIKTSTQNDQPTSVSFTLFPDNLPVAECTIAKGSNTCQTDLFYALGWYWNKQRQSQPSRSIHANVGATLIATTDIQVSSRPAVLVHGFGSSAQAWTSYLGKQGYLASIGVRGFAVGDGQVPGKLNLGDLTNPTAGTGTIQSNAQILRDYIGAVKQVTGAQMVDLIAHSMGNLVSRYYIDRGMPGRDVAQMIMLGPPNQGTDCAYLPSSLGYYLPAVLEIRPSYVQNIFNPQITRRHNVPFSIIAGTPIIEPLKSPCTAVPSDLAIALASASGISAPIKQSDALHTDLNASQSVFDQFIKPLLQRTADEFVLEPDPLPSSSSAETLQFTRVFTGHINPGSSATYTINIDNVAVASFALFDSTRSLTVTVRGATGNVIVLDPTRNGLTIVRDPETLVYLGYGFNNPRPGPWQITLQTTDATPDTGADFALTAQLKGGAVLFANASTLLPKTKEPVQLSARLELGGQPLSIRDATARVRYPNGTTQNILLASAGIEWRASWMPDLPGLYGIDVFVNGEAPDGSPIERSAFLSVEAQPVPEQFQPVQFGLYLGIGVIVALIFVWLVRRGWSKSRKLN
jgi:pimeloyl-ACP methyl ester carboxylesterase